MPSSGFLRKGLESAYNTEYGREVNDQTAINFLYLFFIDPRNNSYEIFGSSYERFKVIGGNQQITDALNNELEGQVQLNRKLIKITRGNNNSYTIYFSTGPAVTADIIVITIPFTLLRQVDLSGLAFPAWKVNAIQHLGYGTNSKLLLGFDHKVWRNFHQSGYVFTNGTPQYHTDYIQTGWDNSQLQGPVNGGYTVFQGGNQGVSLSLDKTNVFLNQLDLMWPGVKAAYNHNAKLIHSHCAVIPAGV